MKIDMKTKLITTLTALLMLVGISAQAQTGNQTPASAESTDLEGDLNHDGKVDVADVTYLVNLIMKNKSEAKDGTYYWYIGTENPSSISDIQTDNTKPGWHEIGASLDGFVLDTNNESNEVILNTENVKYYYYVIIPNNLHIYAADGNTLVEEAYFESATCNVNGYKAFHFKLSPGVRKVTGLIIKEGTSDEVNKDNFYWYIGVDNPASISDIQTDNTKPGWHEIGASLSGFTHDMNNQANWLTLVEDATSVDDMVDFYIVVPNEISIVNGIGTDLTTNGQLLDADCSISGYKAYKYYKKSITVKGIIIRESNEQINDNFYWYIGAENPSVISDIQTDNTKPGWHEIGTALSGFSITFNNANLIEFEELTQYYVIIPNDLYLYAADGNTIMEGKTFNPVDNSSIPGYKVFQYRTAVWDVKGLVIK